MEMTTELIAKYLSGNCNDKEIEELLTWVETSEENKQIFTKLKNSWSLSSIVSKNVEPNLDEYLKNTLNIINTAESFKSPEKFKQLRIQIFKQVAAAVIIAVGLTALISYFIWAKPKEQLVYHQLTVPSGQLAQLTLSDGTKIWLNSKSKLTYPATFASDLREVMLDGEGYFQVSHNVKKPFIVKTSHLDVRVLGTSFNVTNYKDDDEIALALETGAISVVEKGMDKSAINLKPNDLAVYSKTKKVIHLSQADTGLYKSWLKGQFKFRNLSFDDISRRLGRNFNVQFIFVNEDIKQIKYNGSFYNYESLGQILKIMQTNSAFHYKIIKDKVFIE